MVKLSTHKLKVFDIVLLGRENWIYFVPEFNIGQVIEIDNICVQSLTIENMDIRKCSAFSQIKHC